MLVTEIPKYKVNIGDKKYILLSCVSQKDEQNEQRALQ